MKRKFRDNNRATRRKRDTLADRLRQARTAVCDNVRKFFGDITYTMPVDPVPPEQQVRQHVIDYQNQPDLTKPFCMVMYEGKSRVESYAAALQNAYKWTEAQAMTYASIYGRDIYATEGVFTRPNAMRFFSNCAKAITHLTKVKLNIVEDDPAYRGLTPCKIVEGCYTRNGKRHSIKETEFPNVSSSMGRDEPSSGQPCEQRQPSVPDRKAMARAKRATSGGSGSTTISSTTTGVVTRWDDLPLSAFF